MQYKVIPTRVFLKDAKTLKKKYRNIAEDIDRLVGFGNPNRALRILSRRIN